MAPEESWWRDTFGPLIALGNLIFGLVPKRLKPRRPPVNFIFTHYCYIVGWTIVGSILLYPVRNMAYIDALFFSAGMSTQSGLNTIDIDLLPTYQQVVFMLTACVTNPIFINTSVVFVRLYWFEKRFAHIIKEARLKRTRTRELSRSKSQMRGETEGEDDPSRLEMGVAGRLRKSLSFNVRRRSSDNKADGEDVNDNQNTLTDKNASDPVEKSGTPTPEGSQNGREKDGSEKTLTEPGSPRPEIGSQAPSAEPGPPQTHVGLNHRLLDRQITFADEIPNDGHQPPEDLRMPELQDISKHIAFIERQQANAKTVGALRIPGPREIERGEIPKQVDDDPLRRLNTRYSHASGPDSTQGDDLESPNDNRGEGPAKRGITINEPDHPGHRSRVYADDEAATSARQELEKSSVLRRRTSNLNLSEGRRSFSKTWTNLTGPRNADPMPYFEWTATTGRNSTFLGLTQDQREELGGLEYCALKTLAKTLICYFVGFHVLGMVVLLPWILHTGGPWKGVVVAAGQSPGWWGVFTPASMFNDLGFTLTANSMISFDNAILPLLFGSFLVIIGNTGFPCMLRFTIWVLSKFYTQGTNTHNELRFLLDHPRRCFTLLFPSKATWWLFWVLVGLNVIDLIFFVVLDLNAQAVTDLSPGLRVVNGWFQAVSTRTAGFASVNLADLHAAIQVSYMIMMYISVFPVAISVRRTNVYEEKSLGIFGGEEDADGDHEQSYVSQHLRRQLSFDLWFIFLGLFIIAIVEGDRISNVNQPSFTLFSVLFEIVSSYGTVGLSLGYPGINASFSTEFRTISKLIIIAMMVRGRHRGLPYALDRAILLPSEKLSEKEAREGHRQLQRRQSLYAEGEEGPDRQPTWDNGDLDQYGLPAQHTGYQDLHEHAMTAGAGGDPDPDAMRKTDTRRSATISAKPQGGGKEHKRTRSLSRVLASGLSAGPSFTKRD